MGRNYAPPLDGAAIRRARLARFLSQAEVAEQVSQIVRVHGIVFDRSSVSLIENGRLKHPNVKVAGALSKVLGIPPKDIFKVHGTEGETEDEPDATGVAA